jgi:hypothetical protein
MSYHRLSSRVQLCRHEQSRCFGACRCDESRGRLSCVACCLGTGDHGIPDHADRVARPCDGLHLPRRVRGVWHTRPVTVLDERARRALVRRGLTLEWATLGWNVAGIAVLAVAAVTARSVALAGFGLDSLIEIGASTVVIWELSGTGPERQRRALRLIGCAFAVLAVYLLVQSTVVLATGYHPRHSPLGISWTTVTAAVMFALAAGKARTGRALDNPVLRTEGRVTMIDGILAVAVLAGLVLNAVAGWWWADPAAGYVLVYYAVREVREILTEHDDPSSAKLPGHGDVG